MAIDFTQEQKKNKVPIQKNRGTRVSLFVKRKCFPLLLGKFMTHIPGTPLVSILLFIYKLSNKYIYKNTINSIH